MGSRRILVVLFALAVLHTLTSPKLTDFLNRLPQLNLPNLWIPKPSQFIHVDEIPLMGSGKLELRKIRELAIRFSSERVSEPAGASDKT